MGCGAHFSRRLSATRVSVLSQGAPCLQITAPDILEWNQFNRSLYWLICDYWKWMSKEQNDLSQDQSDQLSKSLKSSEKVLGTSLPSIKQQNISPREATLNLCHHVSRDGVFGQGRRNGRRGGQTALTKVIRDSSVFSFHLPSHHKIPLC